MLIRRRVLLACLVVLTVAVAPGSRAQGPQRCFRDVPGINACIEGRLLPYWHQHGELPVFGYPLTNAAPELNRDTNQTYTTQWFQRNRLEVHPEHQPPYDVLLGRLGDDRLRQLGRKWQEQPGDTTQIAGCQFFRETQFNLCNRDPETGAQTGFLTYWRTHGLQDPRLDAYGRSLALFGLPLSRPRMETNANGDTVLTQWFERARFEYHPNTPDPGAPGTKVLLGLLGTEVRAGTATPPPPPGPATPTPTTAPAPGRSTYQVINAYPHDPAAWTQGLVYADGQLYEGTGRNGESTLRRV
ncbi:MAG TPA: glutaminyl-peptide cyclotransferase, partial [Herpetosiphonaceae bacterium]|nr:glutaminyl-peptide cyclotransferase [Herpetosiphonaceae bacterium]